MGRQRVQRRHAAAAAAAAAPLHAVLIVDVAQRGVRARGAEPRRRARRADAGRRRRATGGVATAAGATADAVTAAAAAAAAHPQAARATAHAAAAAAAAAKPAKPPAVLARSVEEVGTDLQRDRELIDDDIPWRDRDRAREDREGARRGLDRAPEDAAAVERDLAARAERVDGEGRRAPHRQPVALARARPAGEEAANRRRADRREAAADARAVAVRPHLHHELLARLAREHERCRALLAAAGEAVVARGVELAAARRPETGGSAAGAAAADGVKRGLGELLLRALQMVGQAETRLVDEPDGRPQEQERRARLRLAIEAEVGGAAIAEAEGDHALALSAIQRIVRRSADPG